MGSDIRITERDMELLKFLAEYNILSLDNARYIYGTVTYQEKRIVVLVKYGYVKRLKHRYITLGLKGKKYLSISGFDIRQHCRNENNIERLNIISDIASCLIKNEFSFTPSWKLKNKDLATQHSRRYIGKLQYNEYSFLVYAIYENKTNKYIKSVHYDIKKESEIKNVAIFANDLEKLMFGKNSFVFPLEHLLLIPYDEYGKFIFRNNMKIRLAAYDRLKELYDVKTTNFKYADLERADGAYIKIMAIIDLEWLSSVRIEYRQERMKAKELWIFCLEELEPLLKQYLPQCNYLTMNREKINQLLN